MPLSVGATGAGVTPPGEAIPEENDALLLKYDPMGEELWSSQFGSATGDEAYSVAVDGEGNVYVVGTTGGAMLGQICTGSEDAFVVHFVQE